MSKFNLFCWLGPSYPHKKRETAIIFDSTGPTKHGKVLQSPKREQGNINYVVENNARENRIQPFTDK